MHPSFSLASNYISQITI